MVKRNGIKGVKWLGIGLVCLVLIGLIFPTWTPNIDGEDSISELEYMEINGTELMVMTRGHRQEQPVVLMVHGGPGCSEIPYIRKYQEELEKEFTIVHYDQRGSGKSYHFFEDYSDLSPQLLVKDLIVLSEQVSKRFDNQQIILLGHSYGTYLGLQAIRQAPELYQGYIGIGQVSDPITGEIDNLNYCIAQAKERGNREDLIYLEGLRQKIEDGEMITPRTYVRKYGGAARLINESKDMVEGILFEPEYNLLDAIRWGIGRLQGMLMEQKTEAPIAELVQEVEVPIWFIMGEYDHMTSTAAAKLYFDQLSAPEKSFIVYEHSAHYPQLEEKDKFHDWMIDTFVGE